MTTRKEKRIEKIKAKAIEILESNSDGVRYSELVREIKKEFPEIPVNTIHGVVWNLEDRLPDEIYKPARGLFRHVKFKEREISKASKVPPETVRVREENFYEPFANWLVNEMEECTKAIPLGRNKFGGKWGTPDVIGRRESRRGDIVEAPTEIVSAEIKADTKDLITAFGQGCSYKLFSHKSYIVIPKNSCQDDIAKLDSLCMIFGIGLVLFDSNNPSNPQFEIRVRPTKHEPDMFYVNKYMKLIEKELWE
ncbi:MAG: hypothetical protein H5T45_06210 [Thermoplasmatales archaeon]|nr:hypothetical protein [Thermoplasmatales archaeon]